MKAAKRALFTIALAAGVVLMLVVSGAEELTQ